MIRLFLILLLSCLWLLLQPAAFVQAVPIRLPVRWCVLVDNNQGGPTFEDPTIVVDKNGNQEESLKKVLWRRHERATDNIFLPKANISFRSGATFNSPRFLEIQDSPSFPGQAGDLVNPGEDKSEFEEVIDLCKTAWEEKDQNSMGIIAVQVNRFVNTEGQRLDNVGGAGYNNSPLGTRLAIMDIAYSCGENICPGTPETLLTESDVFNLGDLQEKLLAHELGHTLSLYHIVPPSENLSCDTCDNLMQYRFPNNPDPNIDMFGTILTADQVDQMVDFIIAGNVSGAENVPGQMASESKVKFNYRVDELGDTAGFEFADIHLIGVIDDPITNEARLLASFNEPLPESVSFQVFFFADTDNDSSTGGNPSNFLSGGLSSPEGVELAAIVNINVLFNSITLNQAVFEFDSLTSQFTQVLSPDISAEVKPETIVVDSLTGESTQIDAGYTLTVIIPGDPIGLLGQEINLEVRAIASLPDGEVIDLDDVRQVLPFETPSFPVCQVNPEQGIPGQSIELNATGLPPDLPLDVFLGDEKVATGNSSLTGNTEIEFTIPTDARTGLRLVTVGINDLETAITADCELEVVDKLLPKLKDKCENFKKHFFPWLH